MSLILAYLPHDVLVGLVHLGEHLGLCGQLALDVRGAEDALQVQPVALTRQPLILANTQSCTTYDGLVYMCLVTSFM